MAPGLEFVHPRGTGLDDLQFFESVIPVAVRPTDDILRFLVGRFDVPQRNLLLTAGQDPVKKFFNHDSKALERFHPAPRRRGDPFPEELHGPCSGSVVDNINGGGFMSKIQGLGKIGPYTIVRIYAVDASGKEIPLGFGVLSPDGSLLKGKHGQTILGSIEEAINLAEEEIEKMTFSEEESAPDISPGHGFSR